MITVTLEENGGQALHNLLEQISGSHRERAFKNLIGVDVSAAVRKHLYARDAKPNRMGGRKTHYYRSAGDSVNHEITATGAAVNVDHIGIRQRLDGGVITPKTAKALTIPVSARAHGKRAREFSDTFILDKSGSGDPDTVGVIVQDLGDGQLDALYVLRTRVDQSPDPTVMPSDRTIVETASESILKFLDRLAVSSGFSAR